MKFKKGDKVRFLNDVGGGVVVRIIDNKMVEILNEDDFEVPVLASELVKISTMEQNAFATEEEEEDDFEFENVRQMQEADDREETWEDEEEYENTLIEIEGNDELKLFLAIVPENASKPSDSDIDVYLINDSNYQAYATVSELDGAFASMQWNNHLEGNTKVKIASYANHQLGTFPTLRLQFLFFRYGRFEPIAPLEKDITIRAQKFYKKGSFVENEFFEEDAIIIKINDEDLSSAMQQYSDQDIKRIAKEKTEYDTTAQRLEQKFKVKTSNSGIKEVDLHIHELIDNFVGMSNAEMLNIQMEAFHKELSLGLKNNEIKKMVFIHGVGAGTLKNELRKSLTKDYPQLYFQDASFKEYGFGATLIILRRG